MDPEERARLDEFRRLKNHDGPSWRDRLLSGSKAGLKAIGAVLIGLVVVVVGFLQCGVFRGGVSDEWVKFSAPDGTFSVERPSNFNPSVKHDQDAGSYFVMFQAGRSAAAGAAGFLGFRYSPTSMGFSVIEGPDRGGTASMWAYSLRSQMSTSQGFKERSFSPTQFQGLEAINFVFDTQEETPSGTVPTTQRIVFVAAEGRIFMVVAFGPRADFDSTAAKRFFDSFDLGG